MLKYKVRLFIFKGLRKILYIFFNLFDKNTTYDVCTKIVLSFISVFKSEYVYRSYGTEIKYNINTDIGFLLFFRGSFEENEINICCKFLKEDSVVFDVGANIGIHATIFSNISVKGFVYCFEPSRDTFTLLCSNLKKRRNTLPLNFGVGHKTQILEFYETTDNAFSSFKDTKRKPIKSLSKVLCYKLDDFVKQLNLNRMDFIKIDVEGFEQEVVEGMSNILANLKPIVFCEIFKGVNSNLNPQLTFDSICKYSYNAFVIEGDKLVKCEKHSENYENYLFIPDITANNI